MSANRRRHLNALPGLKLLMCFSFGVLLLLTGLGYVHCQNQLHHARDEAGKLEKEYQRLRTMTEVVEVSIARLSSKWELQKKRDNGFFKLNDITDDRIVRINVSPKGPAIEAKNLRPVSNGRVPR